MIPMWPSEPDRCSASGFACRLGAFVEVLGDGEAAVHSVVRGQLKYANRLLQHWIFGRGGHIDEQN